MKKFKKVLESTVFKKRLENSPEERMGIE